MKQIKAVIFDMDGVLLDTENRYLEIWSEIAKEYGLDNIENVVRMCIGTNEAETRKIVIEQMGEKFEYKKFQSIAIEKFNKRAKEEGLPVKRGARHLLSYLKEHQIAIGLATSTARHIASKELERENLLSYFDQAVFGDEVERSKPNPDIFLKACEKLGVEPNQAFVIEDSYHGVRAAHAAGAHVIMVPDLLPANEEMEGLADCICKDLTETEKYLRDRFDSF